MGTPYLAEIRAVSFSFAPKGWALCNGQLLDINQNQALFALLGTTYGGDGETTFALPNLQGCTPMHMGNGHTLGEQGGEAAHTLAVAEMPQHVHRMMARDAAGTQSSPKNAYLAQSALGLGNVYSNEGPGEMMSAAAVTSVGGGQPHPNMQPFLTLNYIIAIYGIFPSRN